MHGLTPADSSPDPLAPRAQAQRTRGSRVHAVDTVEDGGDPDLARAVALIRARQAEAARSDAARLMASAELCRLRDDVTILAQRVALFLAIGVPECATPISRARWSWIAVALGLRRAARHAWTVDVGGGTRSRGPLVIDERGGFWTFRSLSRWRVARYATILALAAFVASEYLPLYSGWVVSSVTLYAALAACGYAWLAFWLRGDRAIVGLRRYEPGTAAEAHAVADALQQIMEVVDAVIASAPLPVR